MRFQDEITALVRRKRELAPLDESVILTSVRRALRRNERARERIASASSFRELARGEEFKAFIRSVRASLREAYGLFNLDAKGELGRGVPPERALALHKSSRERLPHYREFYEKVFSVTGKPARILDLGCGLNPYSYPLLGCEPAYVAVDLPNEQLRLLKEWFEAEGIPGETIGLDLAREYGRLAGLGHFDVALLLKLLDSLESRERNVSGKLLDAIRADWLVVSFPTTSVSGRKRIREERRAWFERLVARRGWHSEKLVIGDEAVHLVRKDGEGRLEEYKRVTRAAYEERTEGFARKFTSLQDVKRRREYGEFLRALRGKRILDLGSGPGHDAAFFRENGLEPVCVDLSPSMVARCEERGLEAHVMDAERLSFPPGSFDGVWACASLLHLRKERLGSLFRKLHQLLKDGGVLYLCLKEGSGEGFEGGGSGRRYVAYWREEELRALLQSSFTLIKSLPDEHQGRRFVQLLARKRALSGKQGKK